jgi:anthranilate phosphoribosyltransferase
MRRTLEALLDDAHLSAAEAEDLLRELADPDLPAATKGAVLAALRAKGETAAEIGGFATAMRRLARRPVLPAGDGLVDVVGTGGDGSGSFNFSTASALLAAACGQRVAKHGNRAISSRSGSADLVEALGLPLPLDEVAAGACLAATGFTFLFAPYYHPAMKAIAPVRRDLGIRTVFNILGPLTNPAEPSFLVVGAFSEAAGARMAGALSRLPIERAFVVHGEPGWDEPTPVGPFVLFDVRPGSVARHSRDPLEDCGLPRCSPSDLMGDDAASNARALREVFEGRRGPCRDAIVLGCALALEATGAARTAAEGAAQAGAAIDDGRASRTLAAIASFGAGCRRAGDA